MCAPGCPVAVVLGVPESFRHRLEKHLGERIRLCLAPPRRLEHASWVLKTPTDEVVRWITTAEQTIAAPENLLLLIPTYLRLPPEIAAEAQRVRARGTRIVQGTAADGAGMPWPRLAKGGVMNQQFLDELYAAVVAHIAAWEPTPDGAVNTTGRTQDIIFGVLCGLISHHKMGQNNHSHEDDVLRGMGNTLSSGRRKKILQKLVRERLLGCKPNSSAGGTGDVYWLADVPAAVARHPELAARFPDLAQYLKK